MTNRLKQLPAEMMDFAGLALLFSGVLAVGYTFSNAFADGSDVNPETLAIGMALFGGGVLAGIIALQLREADDD